MAIPVTSGGASELERLLRYLYIQSGKAGSQANSSNALSSASAVGVVQTLNYTVNVGLAATNGSVGYLFVDYSCAIQSIQMVADQVGSCLISILKCQLDQIPNTVDLASGGSDLFLISSVATHKTDFTGWNVIISAGDILEFRVTNITNISRISLGIKVVR